jgi:hypothetical protein
MGRDYVTIREEKHDGKTIMAETLVGHMLLKSAPARVIARDGRYQINGMAWGGPIAAVEVKIDDGPWTKAKLGESKGEFAWRLWSLDWSPAPGDHTITSRAIDTAGNIQPAADAPAIANKKTYWESNGQITRHIRTARKVAGSNTIHLLWPTSASKKDRCCVAGRIRQQGKKPGRRSG